MASERKRARRRANRARARSSTIPFAAMDQFDREVQRWSRWLARIEVDDGTLGDQLEFARALAALERPKDKLELRAQILRTQGEYGGELVDRVVAIIDTSDVAFIARTVAGRVTWLWDGDSVEVAERVRAARMGVRRGE